MHLNRINPMSLALATLGACLALAFFCGPLLAEERVHPIKMSKAQITIARLPV